MKLEKGKKAIDFRTKDIFDNPVDLESYKGNKILLTFYRGASCPFCNLRVHSIIKQMENFNVKGLKVLAFFMSDKEEILKYVGKQKAPFPIIADPQKKYYTLYGLEKSFIGKIKAMLRMKTMMEIFSNGFFNLNALKDDNTLPADFLINKNSEIELAYYGKDFGDHLDIEIINEWINKNK